MMGFLGHDIRLAYSFEINACHQGPRLSLPVAAEHQRPSKIFTFLTAKSHVLMVRLRALHEP